MLKKLLDYTGLDSLIPVGFLYSLFSTNIGAVILVLVCALINCACQVWWERHENKTSGSRRSGGSSRNGVYIPPIGGPGGTDSPR